MANIIHKGEYPNPSDFKNRYLSGATQQELASHYQTNKFRIRKWLNYFRLPLRPQGGGNNRKYFPTKSHLIALNEAHHTNIEMAKKFGMSIGCLRQWKRRFGIRRDYQTTEYQKYSRTARLLSEKTYTKYYTSINPMKHPRKKCGCVGGYQLDHIISLKKGFDRGISIREISHFTNLQMLTWEANLKKRAKDYHDK